MDKMLALDIGGTFIKSAVIGSDFAITEESKFPTPKSYAEFIDAVAALASRADIAGVCAALPGGYDFSSDTVFAPNLQFINSSHFKTELVNRISKPVLIENDANLAALGEYYTGEAGSLIFITLGTGVGGGYIANGELIRSSVTSFEVGHMAITPNGRLCGCGRRGCLDEYCSSSGLIATYRDIAGDTSDMTPEKLAILAGNGDDAALKTFDTYADELAFALINIANLFTPDKIKLGGGLSELSKYFLPRCMGMFDRDLFPAYKGRVKLEIATLKNKAGIIGCGRYFFKSLSDFSKDF